MKKITPLFCSLLIAGLLVACASPEEKAAGYIENADSLFDDGKLVKAEIEYKNALQINQNLPDAWYGLAKIHERNQEWLKVYQSLTKIREVNPKHIDGRIMLGQILLASNQIDQALQDAIDIMDMAPNDARAHSLMAAVQFRLENFRGAQESVERALEIDPTTNEAILVRARVYIAEKQYQDALDILNQAIKDNPENISMYMMKLQAYQELNDLKAIEGVYLTLIEKFPDNIAFRHALARDYLKVGNIDRAEQIFEQIVASDPDNIDEKLRLVSFKYRYRPVEDSIALIEEYIEQDKYQYQLRFQLGELYQKTRRSDEALDIYRRIVNDNGVQPDGLEARNRIALLNIKSGDPDKAKVLIDEVLTNDKGNENALLLQSGFKLEKKDHDGAIVDLRTILRDNPDSFKALGLLGQAYYAKGSNELAIESFTKAFRLSPATPFIANQLASLLNRQRKPKRAAEILLESIRRGNNSVAALKLLTQVKLSLREWDSAEQLAKQLANFEGQEALSQQMLGVIYQGKEQPDESINAFKRAHELAPASAQPIVALVRTYVKNNRVEDAKRFLESVLSVHSDNYTAYFLLGQLSLHENDTPGAIKHFKQALKINPKLDIGYRSLSSIYLGNNKLKDAEDIILQGLKELPDWPALVISLASIYERQWEFDKAIAAYDSLLAKHPNLIVAKNNFASLLTDHRSDRASLDKAHRIAIEFKNSKVPQFRDTYAWASVRLGQDLEEAVVLLEAVVKENERVGLYSYHLGEAYRIKGDIENATLYLKKAVGLEQPDSEVSKKANQSLKAN